MGSLSSSGLVLGLAGLARRVLELGFFSRTCVVAILTTAGSTRLTMAEKELAEGMGSGTTRGVAFVPLNDFIAETRPEITEPIMIPVTSVNATKNDAMILRRRAQLKSSFTCSPMSLLLDFGRTCLRSQVRVSERLAKPRVSITPQVRDSCTGKLMRRVRHCPEGRGSEVMFCGRSIDSLESLDAGTHPFVVKNMRTDPRRAATDCVFRT